PADLHAATWTSLSDYALADGAARFESWEKPYAALLGMGAAIDYALDCGIAAIAERIGQLAGRARVGLDEIPGVVVRDRGSTQSGIVTIRVDDPGGMVADLRARGINTSLSTPDYSQIDFGRDGAQGLVRISPHAYNTEAEIDQLITAVAELSR
ncbi:MAG: aminotransferase class V-fold PLP-dependent enzyme, partial [Candidatus Nanopelagicales bacterium]